MNYIVTLISDSVNFLWNNICWSARGVSTISQVTYDSMIND
jgi:hypothetical protein